MMKTSNGLKAGGFVWTRLSSHWALAAALVGLGSACERAAQTTQEARRASDEQGAIRRYSEDVAGVDTLQQRFTAAWRKANELSDAKALKEAVETQVLPALGAYVAGLRAMPTGNPELARVHRILVDAMDGLEKAFRGFGEGLTGESRTERYAQLLAQMDALAKAEASYLTELEAYYAKNQVDLVPHDGARAPDAR